MALAERVDDHIVIKTEFRDKDLIRAVPGSKYNVDAHEWHVPLSWAGCLTLRGLFAHRLEVGPALIAWATEYQSTFVQPAMDMRDLIDAPGDPVLYPFQRAGIDFLAHSRRVLLTDEMGTGKTVQTIRTLAAHAANGENPFPALVVAPNNMKGTWRKEFGMWWPGVEVVVMDGGRIQRLAQIKKVAEGKAHVLVVNWEALRGHSKLAPYGATRLKHCIVCDPALRGDPEVEKRHKQHTCERCPRELNNIPWTTIIADEAHKAKSPKAKQTRALWALATDATKFRYALTGTPIASEPQDLWSSLHFIDPKSWPTRSKYIDRWCLQSFSPFGGMTVIGLKPETKDEFFAITDPHVRRMPKSLVLTQLPPKTYSTRYVDMSPKQKKAYETMRDDMVAQIDDAGGGERLVAVNPLTQLTRLSQFSSSYAEIVQVPVKDPSTGVEMMESKVQLTEPSNKIDALLDILEELGDKPVVVFAQSRQLIELASIRLEKHSIEHVKIVGGQTSDKRQANIDRFQNGEVRAVLATVGAGGVGITLTRADTCIFLQRSWSMIDNTQSEDRVHRIGAEVHEAVTIVDIVTEGTIEEGQRDALNAKTDRMQEIVRDAELLKRVLGKKRK